MLKTTVEHKHLQVIQEYSWSDTTWVQLGDDLEGEILKIIQVMLWLLMLLEMLWPLEQLKMMVMEPVQDMLDYTKTIRVLLR